MRIFLCYASEDRSPVALAEALLTAEGHDVFFDHNRLKAGRNFRKIIKEHIDACELFVFFVSSSSVRPGRFCLTELEYAAKRWPAPEGHVLGVSLESPMAPLPAYLTTTTVLPLRGDVATAVLDAIVLDPAAALKAIPSRVSRPYERWRLTLRLVIRGVVTAMMLTVFAWVILGVWAPRPLFRSEYVGLLVAMTITSAGWTVYRERLAPRG